MFTGHNVYKGLAWKKKHKSPSDYTFALKCPKTNNAGGKGLKMLCTEDAETLEKWITAIRVAKVRFINIISYVIELMDYILTHFSMVKNCWTIIRIYWKI